MFQSVKTIVLTRRAFAGMVSAAVLVAAAGGVAPAQCQLQWDRQFGTPGIGPGSGIGVFAGTTYNDGTADALYMGGNFGFINGTMGRGVVRYDGSAYTGIGQVLNTLGGPSFASGTVYSMTTFDPDGAGPMRPQLIVAGDFAGVRDANGNLYPSENIIAWDGTSWFPLAGGLTNGDSGSFSGQLGPGNVRSVVSVDFGQGPRLVAVGDFQLQSGFDVFRDVAVWDGVAWAPLGGANLPFSASTLTFGLTTAVHDDGSGQALYIGGRFPIVQASGATVAGTTNIARFNGTSWQSVGGGRPNPAGESHATDHLYSFDADGPGGQPAKLFFTSYEGILAWNGPAFTGPILTNGAFDQFGLGGFAQFNDGTGERLYIGGAGSNGNGQLLRLNAAGSNFEQLPVEPLRWSLGNFLSIVGLVPYNLGSGNKLMAVGIFDGTATIPSSGHMVFDGAAFRSPLPSTPGGIARDTTLPNTGSDPAAANALRVFDEDGSGPLPPALYVAGSFTWAGNTRALNVARLTPSGWSQVGQGLSGTGHFEAESVNGLAVGPDSQTPGHPDRMFAWSQLYFADPLDPNSGFFSSDYRVHKLEGGQWQQLGADGIFTVPIHDMVVTDLGNGPATYAIFYQPEQSYEPASPWVLSWNGSSWQAVGSATFSYSAFTPSAAAFNDGSGKKLWVTIGTAPGGQVATWNGTSWADASAGLPANARPRLKVVNNELLLIQGGMLGRAPLNVYKWNGAQWDFLAAGPSGSFQTYAILGGLDDGQGEKLYITTFATSESLRERTRLWRLDGASFTDLSDTGGQFIFGTPTAATSAIFNNQRSVFFGGNLFGVGGTSASDSISSGGVARWYCPDPVTPPCPADVAGANQSTTPDGVLTADDIIVFLGWFFAADNRANIAGPNQSTVPDGSFTADDIIVFLGRYFAGC